MCQMGDEMRSLWEMSYWTVLRSPVSRFLGLGSMAGRLCSRRAWEVQTALSPSSHCGRWSWTSTGLREMSVTGRLRPWWKQSVGGVVCWADTRACGGDCEPLWPLDDNPCWAIPTPVWPVSWLTAPSCLLRSEQTHMLVFRSARNTPLPHPHAPWGQAFPEYSLSNFSLLPPVSCLPSLISHST